MKNANFMASLKAFFSKAWTATKAFSIKAGKWIVANKLISIPVAVVLVGGIACAIALPIALHEHDFATEWSTDADNHWHSAICSHEEEKSDLGAHAYDNACDTTCNVCGATRTVGAHVYDNACDTTCNTCGAIRTVGAHAYDNDCDATCNTCGATRIAGAHVYDNACDTTCNTCGATRAITHDHADTLTAGDTTHYYLCSVCGDKKDEVAHVFDKTVASSEYLKAAATATTKAQYYKSCVCGAKSATEYFETDKTAGTLANIQDLSKTYDKVELANPTYETNSDGVVTIEWYQGDTKLDAKPVKAGTYKAKVIIAESATYTGISAEKEFTIAKKVLSGLTVDLPYAGTNSFEVPLGAANGILAGDVADGIKVCITFANKNVGAAVTGAGFDADDGDNYTNYELDFTTCTASIVPKVLTNISLGDATYKGSTNFAFALSAYHGLVSGETFLLQVTTASKNVGNAVEIASISYANNNYSIDKSAITLNIVPKTINVTAEFEYSGFNVRQIHAPAPSLSDAIDGDEVYIEIAFDKADVDATVLTGADAPYLDGADCDNYTLGTYSFSIVPKKLTLKAGETIEVTKTYSTLKRHTLSVSSNMFDGYVDTDAATLWLTATTPSKNAGVYTADDVILTPYVGNSAFGTVSHNYDFSEVAATVTIEPLMVSLSSSSYVKVEYNGTSEFTLATPFDLTSANTGGGQGSVSDRDEVYITWIETDDAAITDETFAIDYTLGGADAGNYDIDELGVEITKKKLTNLAIDVTESVYDVPGTNDVTATITLFAKDGIVAGETVQITVTNYAEVDIENGTFELCLKDPADLTQGQEIIALVASGDSANYELVADANGVVGLLNLVECEFSKVNYDGICTCCGTNHYLYGYSITGTLQRPVSPVGWVGEVYKLESGAKGYWDISTYYGDTRFCSFNGVYDANGNEVEVQENSNGISFYVENGTYYVHVEKIADFSSNKTFTFNFAHTLEDDGSMAESAVISGTQNKTYYFRIEEDTSWGAELRIYSDDGVTLLDESDYTLELLDESFNKIAFTYEYPDISSTTGTLVGRAFYIAITLNVDTNVQVEVV